MRTQTMSNTANSLRRQRGSVMIEALVSIVVTSLALLASAALAVNAAKVNQTGRFRAQAVTMVNDIAERIEANVPAAAAGNYALASGAIPASDVDCSTTACTAEELAQRHLSRWHARTIALLPQAETSLVFTAAAGANPARYDITLRWTERSTGHGGGTRANAGTVTDTAEIFAYSLTKAVPQR